MLNFVYKVGQLVPLSIYFVTFFQVNKKQPGIRQFNGGRYQPLEISASIRLICCWTVSYRCCQICSAIGDISHWFGRARLCSIMAKKVGTMTNCSHCSNSNVSTQNGCVLAKAFWLGASSAQSSCTCICCFNSASAPSNSAYLTSLNWFLRAMMAADIMRESPCLDSR